MYVERSVTELRPEHAEQENTTIPLASLRTVPAWVLLGEPGSGKSTAFYEEASACNGLRISIAAFIAGEPDADWRGYCLFLDGLDETRGSGSHQTILHQVRINLKKLGSPNFRIACRAADWYGQSDITDLMSGSPSGDLPVYALNPLGDSDIYTILNNDPQINATDFIENANQNGIKHLLSNPQTLNLIVRTLKSSQWPKSRDEVYQLACDSLIQEENQKHRDLTRRDRPSNKHLLNAAGQIFATLLLSDKSGIALDKSVANALYVTIDELGVSDIRTAEMALGKPLFIQSQNHDTRLEPTHRSIAEYLGARWLGAQIDKYGLPLTRVMNLMCGFDDKVVAGLRGLFGWLSLHCQTARQQLIRIDPMTIVLYSDIQGMGTNDKLLLLEEIRRLLEKNPNSLWELTHAESLSSLYEPTVHDFFLTQLYAAKREKNDQTYLIFLLSVIEQTGTQANMAVPLRAIFCDDTYWQRVRIKALDAWLNYATNHDDLINLLVDIEDGRISDPDDELMGIVLTKAFPGHLSGLEALRFLRLPKTDILGIYKHFWGYTFPDNISSAELPDALRYIAQSTISTTPAWEDHHLAHMRSKLVASAVSTYGASVSTETLFTWLQLGADEYGEVRHQADFQNIIAAWLTEHPIQYKNILGHCYAISEKDSQPLYALFKHSRVLQGVPAPKDIGLWHFEQISMTNNLVLKQEHLGLAVASLWSAGPSDQLNLETLEEWASNAERRQWLDTLLVQEIPEWRQEQRFYANQRQAALAADLQNFSREVSRNQQEILNGTAMPGLFNQLAGVWSNRFSEIQGNTPLERFQMCCSNGDETYELAQKGFKACVQRQDLPTEMEIINLSVKQQSHFIRTPCLIGMDLLWEEDPERTLNLEDAILVRMVTFWLTDGTSKLPAWLKFLADAKPDIIANTLVNYALTSIRAKKDYVSGIQALVTENTFKRAAVLALPQLLQGFPARTSKNQLYILRLILIASLRFKLNGLDQIIAVKLSQRSLEASQKVYYLMAGTLLLPSVYESKLWDYVGTTWQRIEKISEFIGDQFGEFATDLNLSAYTLGKLIEFQTPHAELDWPKGGGVINRTMRLGDQVRMLIGKLSSLGTASCIEMIESLISNPALEKIHLQLLSSKHEAIQKLREATYSFPSIAEVAAILNNANPTSASDLHAMVLDNLKQIAYEIRTSNADPFRQFWTEQAGSAKVHKSENSCRDALLLMLQNRLTPHNVICDNEFDHFNDKRVDIHVSYKGQFSVPIEIKGEWHPELWTGIENQLVPRYTNTKECDGYGIYLVLWIGGVEQTTPTDGGTKPVTPAELEARLAATIAPHLRSKISVFVLDVSWP